MGLELVEEVQRVAAFAQCAANSCAEGGGDQRPVVAKAMATIEICEAGSYCW